MRDDNLRRFRISAAGLAFLFLPTAAFSQGADERFNRIEAQMRSLTGQVEELTFQLGQLQERLQRMQEDNEFRFGELEGGGSAGAGRVAPASPQGAASEPQPPVPTLPPPGQDGSFGAAAGGSPQPPDVTGPGAPPQQLGTLTIDGPPVPGANQPIDPASALHHFVMQCARDDIQFRTFVFKPLSPPAGAVRQAKAPPDRRRRAAPGRR